MSRNLKKFTMIIGLFIIIALCIILKMYIIAGIVCLWLCIYVLNKLTIRKVYIQKEPFGFTSLIRNIDYLFIGDMFNVNDFISDEKSCVKISAPDRSLDAAYEILRHTHSILKERGTVIIAIRGKNLYKKGYYVFDIPFFQPVTIKRLHLEQMRLKAKYMFAFHPLKSIKLLLGIQIRGYKECECPLEEMKEFCDERDIELRFLYLK